MNRHALLVSSVACLMTLGCTASYEQTSLSDHEVALDPAAGVAISVPDDGKYGEKEYRNSGRMTANAIKAAFLKHAAEAEIMDNCASIECVDVEKYGYFVSSTILHWEDRATEWSGKQDRLEVQLDIFDAGSGEKLASTVLQGKSKWVTMGGDHPQDLLASPVDDYVDSLYD